MILFYISIISPQGTHQSRTIHRFSHGKKKNPVDKRAESFIDACFFSLPGSVNGNLG
jgi:hypothetical protein